MRIFNRLLRRKAKSERPAQPLQTDPGFMSLSPIDNVESGDIYMTALNTALRERHINRNIALTGPYGSGKSSILKTFEKNYADDELVFLNISLATFEEKADDKDSLLRLIELSILQQMFYHEEDRDIPDTRFKKVRSFSRKSVLQFAAFIFGFLLVLLLQLKPGLLGSAFPDWDIPVWISRGIHYLSLAGCIVGTFILIWRSIRPIRSLQLKKFNFQDAEFAVDDSNNKSILNEHLDEILYFFEVTDYTVVVIEDLDRFQQTEIFTKLREINLLINYSKKIKRDVAFVYAVRDEMFTDKARAKFFDFIIPVIPVINSANSEAKLTLLNETLKYGVSSDLIDKLSFFIDDMRLLYNILNEFRIYNKKVVPKEQDKLFALMIYKSLYPNDFAALSENSGELYSAIKNKFTYVKEEENVLNTGIDELKIQLSEIEDERADNVKELRRRYVWEMANALHPFYGFSVNGDEYSLDEMTDEKAFELLRTNHSSIGVAHIPGYGSKTYKTLSKKFSSIESLVDKNYTYLQRVKFIEQKETNDTERIKKEIQEKVNQLKVIRRSTFKELMYDGRYKTALEDPRQNQIVNIMLRYGFIDEHYYDYISIFHEGSLSRSDQEFLLNVRAQMTTDYAHPLHKIDKLVSKIAWEDFERHYVFNYNLMDHLLAHASYTVKRKAFLEQLSSGSEISVGFIDGFLEFGVNIEPFVNSLAKAWPSWWDYIVTKSGFPKEKMTSYLRLIIQNVDPGDLKRLDAKKQLSAFITEFKRFPTLLDDYKKLKDVIKMFNIKFADLEIEGVSKEMVDFIYEGNYYAISAHNLAVLLQHTGQYKEEAFSHWNYSWLRQAGNEKMAGYIEASISEYVDEVLIGDGLGANEDEMQLSNLLNNEALTEDQKHQLISLWQAKFTTCDSIEDFELKQYILSENKLEPSWNNVASYYKEAMDSQELEEDEEADEAIDEVLLAYLSFEGVAEALADPQLDLEQLDAGVAVGRNMRNALVINDEIDIDIYDMLMDGINCSYKNIDLSALSPGRASILIKKGILSLSPENVAMLKEHFDDLHFMLIERMPITFTGSIDKFDLSILDLATLLDSQKFTKEQKAVIASRVEDDEIIASSRLSISLAKLALDPSFYNFSTPVLRHFIDFAVIGITTRINLLIRYHSKFTRREILDILGAMPEPYNFIAKGKAQALFTPCSDLNLTFARLLADVDIISGKIKEEKKGVRVYKVYR